MNDFFSFILMVVVLMSVLIFGQTVMHENTHAAIYQENGFASHITYGLEGGLTVLDSNKIPSDTIMAAQANVEAIGYQIIFPVIILMFTLVVCTIYLGWRIDATKEKGK